MSEGPHWEGPRNAHFWFSTPTFIQSVYKHLLSTYHVPTTVPGIKVRVINKQSSLTSEFTFFGWRDRASPEAQSCPTLCDPTDYSPPVSTVHVISQARILEWLAISFSRGSSWPRDWTNVFQHCRRILYQLSHQGSPVSHIADGFPPLRRYLQRHICRAFLPCRGHRSVSRI